MPRRPRDPNQLAKLIVDMATGQAPRDMPTTGPTDGASTTWNPPPDYGTKNPAAVQLGRPQGREGAGEEPVRDEAPGHRQESRRGTVAETILIRAYV